MEVLPLHFSAWWCSVTDGLSQHRAPRAAGLGHPENCTLWILGFCTACSHQTPCNQLLQGFCSPCQDQPLCLPIITGTTQSREGQGQPLAVDPCPPDYPTERWFCALECSQGNLPLANCSHRTRAWLEGLSKKTSPPKKCKPLIIQLLYIYFCNTALKILKIFL